MLFIVNEILRSLLIKSGTKVVKETQLILHFSVLNKKAINLTVGSSNILKFKIDSVHVWWLPFDDLLASSRVVRASINCENESIVLMKQNSVFVVDHLEQIRSLPNLKNILLVNINEWLVSLSFEVVIDSLFVFWLVLPNSVYGVVLLNNFLRFLQTVSEVQMHHVRVPCN